MFILQSTVINLFHDLEFFRLDSPTQRHFLPRIDTFNHSNNKTKDWDLVQNAALII